MYSVKGDDVFIYNDIYTTESMKALEPKLSLKDNSAGTFEITLPPGNAGYDKLQRMSSEITVYRDKNEIWSGRIISEKKDFWNNRILTCEGELAYLNDTTQPPKLYENYTIGDFLNDILNIHNKAEDEYASIENRKLFFLGSVEFNDNGTYDFTVNDDVTLNVITEQLINKFGGHLRIRKVEENGEIVRRLDYLKDWPSTNTQIIRFGQNLLDFTRNWDVTDFVNVVIPRASKTTDEDTGLDEYIDVKEANGGSRYITNEDSIREIGWIEKVIDFDESDLSNLLFNEDNLQKLRNLNNSFSNISGSVLVSSLRHLISYIDNNGVEEADSEIDEDVIPALLKVAGENYLAEQQFDNMVIEVNAVDLRYLGVTADSIRLLDNVQCISRPHGLKKTMPVSELTIQLDKPDNSTYVLSDTVNGSTSSASVTKTINKQSSEIAKSERTAMLQATQMINSATRGYVTVQRDDKGTTSLAVSDDLSFNPKTGKWNNNTKLWIWNINGFGYSSDGGRTIDNIAITRDGTISANRIKTGVLSGFTENSKWNLDTGEFTMKKGLITLGSGKFSVNDNGYLKSEYGLIGGFTISSNSIYNDVISLENQGLFLKINNTTVGKIGTNSWVGYPSNIGLTMDLETEGYFISWSWREHKSDDIYTVKLLYTSRNTGPSNLEYTANRLHFACDLDAHGFEMHNLRINSEDCKVIDGLNTGDNVVILPVSFHDDGSVDDYYSVRIVRGFVIKV